MKTRLKLFFKWGIQFEDAYSISEKAERKVKYADSREVEAAVLEMFTPNPIPVDFSEEFSDNISQRCVMEKRTPKTKR